MPICRQCKESFPNNIIVDGKKKSLRNRKFCLNCSPYGSRNTKPNNPGKPSYRKQIDGKKVSYSDWSEEAKEDHRARLFWKAHNRKLKLVEIKGGACQECGYDKNQRVLTFHHRDPSQKCFPLDKRTIQTKSWDDVLKEAEKCDLLCQNCHQELEYEQSLSRYMQYQDKFSHL